MIRYVLLSVALMLPCWAGPMISVSDSKGRSLEIEILAVNGDSVRFRRVDTGKDFTVPMDTFDAPSRTKIRAEAADLPAEVPPLDVEMVVGKRRSKGNSYYMVTQTISCNVKLRNRSHNIPLPELDARVFFIGQNQRTPNVYTVLSVQDFKVSLDPGRNSATPLEPFITSYDSDNKGQGNIGGYQYDGYLFLLLDKKKEVVFHQTTSAVIRRAVDGRPALLTKIADYPRGAYLNEKMERKNIGMGPPEFMR